MRYDIKTEFHDHNQIQIQAEYLCIPAILTLQFVRVPANNSRFSGLFKRQKIYEIFLNSQLFLYIYKMFGFDLNFTTNN